MHQYFEFTSPLLPNEQLFAKLIDVVDFRNKTPGILPWLRIEIFQRQGVDNIGNIILNQTGKVVIPLGAGFRFERLVHIYMDEKVKKANKFASF